MSNTAGRIYGLLREPRIYDAFLNLAGARRVRQRLVRDHIRPFPGARIIDIGCGTADILNYLPEDIEYTGVDPDEKYIEHARSVYGTRASFECADVGRFMDDRRGRSGGFDIALAIGLLHHLEDDAARKVFLIAREVLAEKGRLVTLDAVFLEKQNVIAKFIISKDRGKNVRTPEAYDKIARSVFPGVEKNISGDLFRVPYSHIIMHCSKKETPLPLEDITRKTV